LTSSESDDLLGMEMDCCAHLGDPDYTDQDPGLWERMSVRRLARGESLIVGQANGRLQDGNDIATALTRIWEEHWRYSYRAAQTVISTPSSITSRAIAQIAPGGFWVTLDVRIALA
jgi:hypothetical protein